jgi:hypothetical protein
MSHVKLNDIDLSQLKIAKSGRFVKLMYGKEPLQLAMGKLYSPFGVKVNPNNYSQFDTCVIDCSLNQSQSEISIAYRNSIEALDKRIVELISENVNMFNTGNDHIDFDENIYSPILRENKTYPKLMKINLPRDNKGNFDLVVFNKNTEKVPLNDNNITTVLRKGTVFKSIIECTKMWYFKGRFGTTWNLKQMLIDDPYERKQTQNTVDNSVYQTNMID